MIYRWSNRPAGKVKAQEVGEEIEKILSENDGHLKPKDIVEHAAIETNPLHACFEWDNSKAASAYRIEQAKFLLRSIVVVQEQEDEEPVLVRAFVSVQKDDSPHYTSIYGAVNNPEEWDYVIKTAYVELQSWRQKYKDLQKFSQIFEVIDSLKIA